MSQNSELRKIKEEKQKLELEMANELQSLLNKWNEKGLPAISCISVFSNFLLAIGESPTSVITGVSIDLDYEKGV